LASAEIKIPNLVPGKRYRMVVETANSAGLITVGTTSVPSIEFVVPSANQLLSSYTPIYSVKVDNYPATGGQITGYLPGISTPVGDTITAYSVAKSKKCNNSPIISGGGNYNFRFSNLAGAPPIGQTFSASGMNGTTTSKYYDNLLYTVQSYTSNNNIVAVGRLNGEAGWAGQSKKTKDRWRDQGGAPFGDLNSTASGTRPTISWTESGITRTANPPIVGAPRPIYAAIVPGYSVTSVTVSVPQSLALENNFQNGQRVVEIPVFFYIKNGIFYDLNNNVMSGLPPSITSVPSAIPRSGVNVNPKNTALNEISLRSYRFSVARYTQLTGLWSAEWSQTDDAYGSEPLMRDVIYSGQAIL